MDPTTDRPPPINSPQWWDDYFRNHWNANGGAEQTRHFMQRLIAELPAVEESRLRNEPSSILDWGCAQGEGVDELARAFPKADVWGLDAAGPAIDEARRRFPGREFVHAPDGTIPRPADVVVSSNCLEHFVSPWPVAERLARAARELLILLVPCDEAPLCESHFSQFDADGFPERIGGMWRMTVKRIAVDPRQWGGDQVLAVYATAGYLARRGLSGDTFSERAKWDRYYASTELEAESEVMARFGQEFARAVSELLPDGGRVLEAGAGGGWHSLALARTGRFEVTLMDFSEEALRHARQRFAQEGREARFVLADAREPGAADFDLVFNSGVLEHFPFEEQVELVRAMASRSRDLVLAIVPNRRCYWYWIWRTQATARGDWPFGKEMPAAELGSVFDAAGLAVVGERVLGQEWTESFFGYLEGIHASLLDDLLAVHRSPLVPDDVKGYLLGALGRVAGGRPRPTPGWRPSGTVEGRDAPALAGALADALALQVRLHGDLLRLTDEREGWRRSIEQGAAERERLREELRGLETRLAEAASDAEARRSAAAAEAAQARQEQANLAEALRGAVAAERDGLARERDDLLAWQRNVSASLTFRLLRRIDHLRALLRWPSAGRRQAP